MSEQKQNITLPESITINGNTYFVKDTPELQGFIQAVSKVEKSKLYSKFEDIKKEVQNLSQVQVVEPTMKDDDLVERLKKVFVTSEGLKDTLKSTVEEVVQPILTATKRNQLNEIEEYRNKLIKENEATCIPELVKGATKEELDKSLKESIRIRQAYSLVNPPKYEGDPNIKKMEKELSQKGEIQTPTPKPTDTPLPNVPNRPSPDVDGAPQGVKKMSMSEFAKKRDALRSQLETLYGSGTL